MSKFYLLEMYTSVLVYDGVSPSQVVVDYAEKTHANRIPGQVSLMSSADLMQGEVPEINYFLIDSKNLVPLTKKIMPVYGFHLVINLNAEKQCYCMLEDGSQCPGLPEYTADKILFCATHIRSYMPREEYMSAQLWGPSHEYKTSEDPGYTGARLVGDEFNMRLHTKPTMDKVYANLNRILDELELERQMRQQPSLLSPE